MLKVLVRNARHFVSGFWENEVSQMTKMNVMGIASVLAVLVTATLPLTAHATCPCSPCDGQNPCGGGSPCSISVGAQCSGSGICDHNIHMVQCSGQPWDCGSCPG